MTASVLPQDPSPLAPPAAPGPVPALATTARHLGSVALVGAQLLLALLVIRQFQIESRTFFNVMLLGTVGFVIHALLPMRYRLPFFTLLSLGATVLALGVVDGISVILLGVVLIGLCHLPVKLAVRVALVLATAALYAVWRGGALPAPWSTAIWPVLGSMFMFRLALYLHALSHDEKRPTLAWTLSYFFMLPNVCFPLYPVVDYSTFVRTYYDRDDARIYQTGVKWIARGLVHLILYRFVYVHLTMDPGKLVTLGDLVQFILSTFLLYLRVSGQFHLITGVLHLYGFRLPETHHLYYLASSFTDFWRRINIYWKDFMMKLVYYPSFFRLRRWGNTRAMVGATVVVFFATWILHSYQWFWLRGGFPLTPQDTLFWAILGGLVVFGSLRETKRPRKRTLGRGPVWSASRAIRTVGTFTAIAVLWSLWSTESVMQWLVMWSSAGTASARDLLLLAGLLGGGLLIAGRAWQVRESDDRVAPPFYRRPAVLSTATLLAILVVGKTDLYARTAPAVATTVASLQRSTLNARDATLQHKGYYENLHDASRMSVQLWSVRAQRPASWIPLSSTAAYHVRSDFMRAELRPNTHITFLGKPLTTNRWGMRDGDYALAKPAGTYRIALLGPSYVMGSGVADGETISDLLESRLNDSIGARTNVRFEVLNFGVAAYSMLQQLSMLTERGVTFQPDAVFITADPGLREPIIAQLLNVISAGTPIPFPGLDSLVHRGGATALAEPGFPVPYQSARTVLRVVGINTRMPWSEAERRLRLQADSLVAWNLREIASVAHRHGAVPVFVAMDIVVDTPTVDEFALKSAANSGFLVFNLLDLWNNRDRPPLRIAPWDEHPNVAGNALIVDRLYSLIQQRHAELRIPSAAPASQH